MSQGEASLGLKQSALVVSAISRRVPHCGPSSAVPCALQRKPLQTCAGGPQALSFDASLTRGRRCARSMLGPSEVVKLCVTPDSADGDNNTVAICSGSGLMEALNVEHPAASLLKEAVNGQQVIAPFPRALPRAFPSEVISVAENDRSCSGLLTLHSAAFDRKTRGPGARCC
jgi:hypothetical protein